MPRYRLLQDVFIEPQLIKAGSMIEYNGPPGPHFDPLDDSAKAAMDKYYEENPHASLNPVEGLSKTMEPISVTVLAPPNPTGELVGIGNLALSNKTAGPTEGGRVADDAFLIRKQAQPPGGIVVADPPGIGVNAPSVEGTDPADAERLDRPNVIADDPAMGDPTKPGEKGAEHKAEADKANTDATAVAQGGKPSPSGPPKLEVK